MKLWVCAGFICGAMTLVACTFPTSMKLESVVAQDANTMLIEVSSSEDWLSLSRSFWGGEPYLIAGICGSKSHNVPSYVEREAFVRNGRYHYQISLSRDLSLLGRQDSLPGGGWVGARGWPRELVETSGLCLAFEINGVGSGYRSPVLRVRDAEMLVR